MDFELTTGERSGRTVVTVAGELDLATAPQLTGAVAEAEGNEAVVIDLTGVDFIDSTGVRSLVNIARDHQGFSVVCPRSNVAVHRVLDLTGFGQLLTVHPSFDDLDGARSGR